MCVENLVNLVARGDKPRTSSTQSTAFHWARPKTVTSREKEGKFGEVPRALARDLEKYSYKRQEARRCCLQQWI